MLVHSRVRLITNSSSETYVMSSLDFELELHERLALILSAAGVEDFSIIVEADPKGAEYYGYEEEDVEKYQDPVFLDAMTYSKREAVSVSAKVFLKIGDKVTEIENLSDFFSIPPSDMINY